MCKNNKEGPNGDKHRGERESMKRFLEKGKPKNHQRKDGDTQGPENGPNSGPGFQTKL